MPTSSGRIGIMKRRMGLLTALWLMANDGESTVLFEYVWKQISVQICALHSADSDTTDRIRNASRQDVALDFRIIFFDPHLIRVALPPHTAVFPAASFLTGLTAYGIPCSPQLVFRPRTGELRSIAGFISPRPRSVHSLGSHLVANSSHLAATGSLAFLFCHSQDYCQTLVASIIPDRRPKEISKQARVSKDDRAHD
ncbi:hypothetical protein B0H11DRAFT_2186470 [Mycena galericulata]|nr:hypothetical protein B0H11DRAFT_2186470 [Mycena galericulata]